MYDQELTIDILKQVLGALYTIHKRFEPIKHPDDFINSPEGLEKLDAICMQLIAVGESLKKIDKIANQNFFSKYPEINWQGAKAMRDIISHHYFDIDAEVVFDVCHNKISPMIIVIEKMLNDLTK
jgi:uncharacterized protein with HEPN domain